MIDYDILIYERLVAYLEKFYSIAYLDNFRRNFSYKNIGKFLNSKNIKPINDEWTINGIPCEISYDNETIIISTEELKILIESSSHIYEYNSNGLVESRYDESYHYTSEEVTLLNENQSFSRAISPELFSHNEENTFVENHNAAVEYFNGQKLTR
ncbi:MAG: hypothetical protein E7163_03940 [Firmicutes bacterium]|nr:hypothetical protein [Bacillota bacterium]